MRIPHLLLTPAALRAVVEEYVTRDGTDHSAIPARIERVLRQLNGGHVELHYEEESATCNIVSIADSHNSHAGSEDA